MDHILLEPPLRTRLWKKIASLVAAGAGLPQITSASVMAVRTELQLATKTLGFVEALRLLIDLPMAARKDDFVAGLREIGIDAAKPSLMAIIAAYDWAIDVKTFGGLGSTDAAEMARMAAIETFTAVVSKQSPRFFHQSAEDVRLTLAELAAPVNTAYLVRAFFSRFIVRLLQFHLSRILPAHTGPGKRFATLTEQRSFTDALDYYCFQVAKVVEEHAVRTLAWDNFPSDQDETAIFAAGAMLKLLRSLRQGRCIHA